MTNNWAITYDADLIPIVELIVNSPLDTSTNFLIGLNCGHQTSPIIGGVFSLRYNKTKITF